MKNQSMADTFADVMKTVRMEPATRHDIAVHAGITLDTADRWIKRLAEHGMLAPYTPRKASNGNTVKVWAVTKAWGGAGMNETPTPREIEALRLVADGRTNREIAQHMRLSVETVKDHIGMASMRLRARNRAHAAVLAIRKGLL